MEFLALTAEFRATEPVSTNVIGSVATSVAQGARYDDYFWWVVEGEDGVVRGCAMRTAPWRLAVPELDLRSARALGAAVALADPGLPGVNGPRPAVDAVYQGMGVTSGVEYGRESHLLVLDELQPARTTQGGPRSAKRDDLGLVLEWFGQFEREVDAVSPDRDETWRNRVEVKVGDGAVLLWEVGGQPVSLAGHAPLVDSPSGPIARIGPVYTPESRRRHGYGTAVTSALVQRLLPDVGVVMLYADAANPTSNGIYESLGFQHRATTVETKLVRPNAAG